MNERTSKEALASFDFTVEGGIKIMEIALEGHADGTEFHIGFSGVLEILKFHKRLMDSFTRDQERQDACEHDGYVTLGRKGYPWTEDRGPYCPACDGMVDL